MRFVVPVPILCCFLMLFMANAQAEELLIQGRNEGLFCGQEEGDYVHSCVKIAGKEFWLWGGGANEAEAAHLARLPKGTAVVFTFDVVRATLEEAGGEPQTLVVLTSIQPKK